LENGPRKGGTSPKNWFPNVKGFCFHNCYEGRPRLDGRSLVTDAGAETGVGAGGPLTSSAEPPQGNRIAKHRRNGVAAMPERFLNLQNVLKRIPKHPGRKINRVQQPSPLPPFDAFNTAAPAGRQLATGDELACRGRCAGGGSDSGFSGCLHTMSYRPFLNQPLPREKSGRVFPLHSATFVKSFKQTWLRTTASMDNRNPIKPGYHPTDCRGKTGSEK